MKLIECVRCLDNESRHLLHAVIYRDRDDFDATFITNSPQLTRMELLSVSYFLLNLRISTFHKSRFY